MMRHSVIVVVLLGVLASVAFISCGSDSSSGVYSFSEGGWITNPTADNNLNFFVVNSSGDVTHHGFRADSAEILNSTGNTFQLAITVSPDTFIVNGTMTSSTSATYTVYPGEETGTITKVSDLSDCSQINTSWQMDLTHDFGASGPSFKATREPLIIGPITYTVWFSTDSEGDMTYTGPGNIFNTTGGKMVCSGSSLDDFVVGLMTTNAVAPYNEYSTVKFAGIVNGVNRAWGLYDTDSATPWPVGSFKLLPD